MLVFSMESVNRYISVRSKHRTITHELVGVPKSMPAAEVQQLV